MSTPREKLQDTLVLHGRKSPILMREDATRYRSSYHETFVSGPRQIRPCGNREAFAQRMSELCEFDRHDSTETCSAMCLGSQKLHCDSEDNTLTQSPSSWTAISLVIQFREKHYDIGGSDQ